MPRSARIVVAGYPHHIIGFEFLILSFKLFGSKAGKPIQNPTFKINNQRFTGAVNRLTGSLTVNSSKIREDGLRIGFEF